MMEKRPIVVVGTDGSEASKDAIRWAARQAELIDGELHAIIAWDFPLTYGYFGEFADAEWDERARATLQSTVTQALGEPPPVPTTLTVVQGHPVQAMINASRSADLLVVGRRGLGAFAGMMLGSVSEGCVRHASCPVVIVRGSTDEGDRT